MMRAAGEGPGATPGGGSGIERGDGGPTMTAALTFQGTPLRVPTDTAGGVEILGRKPAARDADALDCPYCFQRLDETPRSRDRCPSCDRTFWVGSGPDGALLLLRDTDLASHTARWSQHHERARWSRIAEPFVDADAFAALEIELADEGLPNSPRDVFWTAADRALGPIVASGRLDIVRDAYATMARAAYEEGDLGSPSDRALEFAREAARAQLRLFGSGRVMIGAACACDACAGSVGIVEVARELVAPRLPHEECRSGWCPCEYRPAGRLIGLIGRR